MITAWMIAATLFAGLLGVAAYATERALRSTARAARGAWLFALAAAVGWPALAPAAIAALAWLAPAGSGDARAPLDAAGASFTTIAAGLPVLPRGWMSYLDFALVALWALASMLLLVRLALAMRVLAGVERAAAREVIGGVPVLVTPSIGPAVFGLRRSRVLVPRWLLELDAPLKSLVLRHEQEHCRARDPQLTLAVAVALVLVPWNAGVWWIARRLRLAVELDCDARVLRDAEDPERYSKLLLFISHRQSLVRLAPMLAESNSHLSRRISAMNAPRPRNPRVQVAVFAALAVGALAYSTRFAAELTAAPSMPATSMPARAVARATSAVAKPGPVVETAPAAIKAAPGRGAGKVAAPRVVQSSEPRFAPAISLMPKPQELTQGPGDRNVMAIPGSQAPRYPDILKAAGVEGGVLVAFVVDTNGVADAGSIKILRSTHKLFTEAVATAIPNMHFRPAILNSVKVKQVVRLPVLFNIVGSALANEEGQRASLETLVADAQGANFFTIGTIVVTALSP